MQQALKTNPAPGDTVRLVDSSEWGLVVENLYQWDHWGSRVLWTSTGEVLWSPHACLEIMSFGRMSEETESLSMNDYAKK